MKPEEDFESSDEDEDDCPEDTPVCDVRLCERSIESPRALEIENDGLGDGCDNNHC